MILQISNFFQTYPWILDIIWITLIVIISIFAQKLIGRAINKVALSKGIEKHAVNALMLLVRLIIVIVALSGILAVIEVPSGIIVSISTLTGTALGLASSRSVGNIFAGLWVLITNPYKVGDYINFGGGLEGIIEEISLNYTKLITPLNDLVLISNQRILDKDITNYKIEYNHEKKMAVTPAKSEETAVKIKNMVKKKVEYAYKYPILMSFNNSLISVKTIHQVFDSIIEKNLDKFLERPKYEPYKRTAIEKGYAIYIIVKKAESLFQLVPQMMEEISNEIDALKNI